VEQFSEKIMPKQKSRGAMALLSTVAPENTTVAREGGKLWGRKKTVRRRRLVEAVCKLRERPIGACRSRPATAIMCVAPSRMAAPRPDGGSRGRGDMPPNKGLTDTA
jgi:hypothetical protein